MTFQDEFVRRLRVTQDVATGDGGGQDKPLLFRGGDIRGGGDADASLASANGGGAGENGLEMEGRCFDERHHPTPVSGETAPGRFRSVRGTDRPDTFEKEGLKKEEHTRHCEERSDAAIQSVARRTGLLPPDQVRGRNDDENLAVSGQDLEPAPRAGSIPCPVEPRLSSEQRPSESQTSRSDTGSGLTDTSPAPRHAELDSASRAVSQNGSDKTHTIPDQVRDDEAPTPTTRHDGWHLDLRVKFLEALAQTGNVQASAYFVQRTRQSAYDLKRRDPDFARGWLAALVLAREEAQDKLQERAIEGVEEEIFYHGEVVATRRRYDSRLLLAHLARLDKIAEQIPAQRGAARFGELLDAIGAGEDTAPLVATPTEDELAALAAEAEAWREPEQPQEEEDAEFYAVTFPDDDGPPDYYRMTPEEAAEMERDVPGLVARPTGTADDAVINALVYEAEALAEFRMPGEEKGKNL